MGLTNCIRRSPSMMCLIIVITGNSITIMIARSHGEQEIELIGSQPQPLAPRPHPSPQPQVPPSPVMTTHAVDCVDSGRDGDAGAGGVPRSATEVGCSAGAGRRWRRWWCSGWIARQWLEATFRPPMRRSWSRWASCDRRWPRRWLIPPADWQNAAKASWSAPWHLPVWLRLSPTGTMRCGSGSQDLRAGLDGAAGRRAGSGDCSGCDCPARLTAGQVVARTAVQQWLPVPGHRGAPFGDRCRPPGSTKAKALAERQSLRLVDRGSTASVTVRAVAGSAVRPGPFAGALVGSSRHRTGQRRLWRLFAVTLMPLCQELTATEEATGTGAAGRAASGSAVVEPSTASVSVVNDQVLRERDRCRSTCRRGRGDQGRSGRADPGRLDQEHTAEHTHHLSRAQAATGDARMALSAQPLRKWTFATVAALAAAATAPGRAADVALVLATLGETEAFRPGSAMARPLARTGRRPGDAAWNTATIGRFVLPAKAGIRTSQSWVPLSRERLHRHPERVEHATAETANSQ